MTRLRFSDADMSEQFQSLTNVGDGAPTLAEKLELARTIRGRGDDTARLLDGHLLQAIQALHLGLAEAEQNQTKLKQLLEKLGAPPWYPAVFLGHETTACGQAALVCVGSSRRVVPLDESVDVESLAVGDEVLLSSELNAVVAESPYRYWRGGETAVFDRIGADGRLVLKWRDNEEVIVNPAAGLEGAGLRIGDLVRWDRNLWLAFEKIERSQSAHLFMEDTPDETFDNVGGLDAAIERLQRLVLLHLEHPDTVGKYGLRRKGSVLLVGPPGTGKTMLTRALANWLARLSTSGQSRFMNLKPASLHSVWYSESEANYREAFRVARETAEQEPEIPVVMFFDEADAIGAARGSSLAGVDDRVLTALMAELDGLETRGNVLVIAATNRAEALDPALLRPGRLGDLVVEVPRPDRSAARAIFAKHLREDIPLANSEHVYADGSLDALVDSALTRIYSPNGSTDLATIIFRDGRQRTVKAHDLVSGAVIANICTDATERACLREIESGEPGLRRTDLLTAIDDEFAKAARILTPANGHRHIGDLPQDQDVVRIDPIVRRVRRTYRFLKTA